MQSSRLAVIFASVLLAHAASSQEVGPTHLKFCTSKKTISLQIITNSDNDEVSCQCTSEPVKGSSSSSATRSDYVHAPGIGSHKLHTDAKSWSDARKICVEEGGHLAIINSRAEESVLVEMLKKHRNSIHNGVNTEEAFLGIHDFFKEGDWVTVLGGSLYTTGYAHWSPTYWGGQPDNKDKNQNCAALIDQGGMDDVHCHERFAFFCELPLYCE